jgi:uncharacterized membrane protein YfcA
MEIWQGTLLFAAGCLAGFVNVMAGGGSVLTMPSMIFLGMPGPAVNGTNRVAILVQNATAVAGFFRKGFSDFRLSLSLTLCALPGTVVGAMLGTKLEGVWFNRVLAAVMVAVLVLMAKKKKGPTDDAVGQRDSPAEQRLVLAHLLMVGAGFYGGFLQAGVGFIMMAILHRTLGLDLVRVNMHKVFIVGVYTLVALAVFALQGHVYWAVGLTLAGGNAIGAWLGTHYAVKGGERLIRIIFNLAVGVLALKLLINSLM